MKSIKMELSKNSIENALEELKSYQLRIHEKSEIFVSRLLDEGIQVAYQHVGRYAGYVEFIKEVENNDKECVGMLIGRDSQPFISTWKVKGGERQAEVSGILMSEFGSGWLSKVIWNVSGVGQGTFPGQKHAFAQNGWYWVDLDGNKHHSIGEAPNYPMYFADMTMLSQIDSIAREVFNGI